MASAREQARKAAAQLVPMMSLDDEHTAANIADAASDAWEPLLRDLLTAFDWMEDEHACCAGAWDSRVVDRVRSALG